MRPIAPPPRTSFPGGPRPRIAPILILASLPALASCSGSGPAGQAHGEEKVSRVQSASTSSIYDVLTRNYNTARTGVNPNEFWLNTGNVNSKQFGKLFQVYVDDQVYAQVLYRWNLLIQGNTHNVMFVATVNNSVYAFDADTGETLWQQNYNGSGRPTRHDEVGQNCAGACIFGIDCHPYLDFSGNIGIVGTPVIDDSTSTMYFVTRTVESGATVQQLRAIDITTTEDRPNSPVTIQANFGDIAFDPTIQNQRPALTLSNGSLTIAWSSFCDTGAYHGWAMAYDPASLMQQSVWVTTPTGDKGGIWQGGAGLAVDGDGYLYAATGNGAFAWSNSYPNYGYSLVKLFPTWLIPLDSFTSSSTSSSSDNDVDFGSSGPVFLPIPDLLAVGSKEGEVYVFNRNSLGGFVSGDSQIVQKFQAVQNPQGRATSHIHGTNVTWTGADGPYLYVWGENDYPRQYRWNASAGQFDLAPRAIGQTLPPDGMPGGMMTLSASSSPGTGILWATTPLSGDANHSTVPGILRAFDAETMGLLWESTAPADDSLNFAKFNPPVVTYGKVFVPSFSNTVSVYGIKQDAPVYSGQIVDLRKRNTPLPPLCMELAYASTAPGQTIQLNGCNASVAQDWQLNEIGSGAWEIRRPGLNLCMEVPGGQVFEGQMVQQDTCDGSAAQQFTLSSSPGGMTIHPTSSAVGSDYCVTAANGGNEPGDGLVLSACTGGVTGIDAQVFTPAPSQLLVQDSGLCVDAPYGYLTQEQLQAYPCNNQENQSWQITWWADGSQGIQRNGMGWCFDVPNGNAFAGQIVQQFPCNGSPAQEWLVEGQANGFQVRFNNTSLCLDVDGSTNLLRLESCTGVYPQVFGRYQPQLRMATSGAAPGLCINDGENAQDDSYLDICRGFPEENLQLNGSGELLSSTGTCLVTGNPPFAGEQLFQTDCNSLSGYFTNQWAVEPLPAGGGNQIRSLASDNLCINVRSGYNTQFTYLHLDPCDGSSGQRFAL
jgi:Ricin-type beta-trefoil lectin domain/Ricin-type beta-trefoil lectin domain-like/PQQ enzyme repeat